MSVLKNKEERIQVLVSISIVVLFICSNTPAAVLIFMSRAHDLDGHLEFQVFRHPFLLDVKPLEASFILTSR